MCFTLNGLPGYAQKRFFLIFDFYIQAKNHTRIKHAKTFGRPMSGDNIGHVG